MYQHIPWRRRLSQPGHSDVWVCGHSVKLGLGKRVNSLLASEIIEGVCQVDGWPLAISGTEAESFGSRAAGLEVLSQNLQHCGMWGSC